MLSDIPSFREAVDECALEEESYRRCSWGYLVKVDDPSAYRAAIFDFIENKTEWDKMKRSSFKMSEKYNIQTTARKYIEVYSSLMD